MSKTFLLLCGAATSGVAQAQQQVLSAQSGRIGLWFMLLLLLFVVVLVVGYFVHRSNSVDERKPAAAPDPLNRRNTK